MVETPANSDDASPNQSPLTTSQRAMAAARLVRQLAEDAEKRQKAGTRAQNGVKGKAAARVASQHGVSTRLVELAITVRKRGAPELIQAVENGQIPVLTAAKVVKLGDKFPHAYDSFESQRQAVAEIVAGRPVRQVLAAFGIQDRGPISFDEKTLKQTITQLKKITDLRAKAFGPNDAYRQAREHLDLYQRAMNRWRTERLDEPVPVLVDDFGRRVPLAAVSAFQTAQEMQITCGQVDALIGQIVGLSRRPGGELLQVQVALHHLNEVRKIITDARPESACDYCTGPTCSCRGRGWFAADRNMNQSPPYRTPAPAPISSETPTKTQAPNSEPPETTASAQEPPPHPVNSEEHECSMCYLPPPGDKDCPRCQARAEFESRRNLARNPQITRKASAAHLSALAYLNNAPSDTF
jgi:hypothetical protein